MVGLLSTKENYTHVGISLPALEKRLADALISKHIQNQPFVEDQ
jgi:hypothetical protein